MRVTRSGLYTMLNSNVVELRFNRRDIKPGWKTYRRMLATTSRQLLNGAPGLLALHFEPPKGPPPFNRASKNLVCAWDLFWQEYRLISCEAVDVVTLFPVVTVEDQNKFWNYFNQYLISMSPQNKISFMNT